MMKITTEEKDKFLNAVSQELFKKNYRKLAVNLRGTVILNLGVQKKVAEPEEQFVYDEVILHAKKVATWYKV